MPRFCNSVRVLRRLVESYIFRSTYSTSNASEMGFASTILTTGICEIVEIAVWSRSSSFSSRMELSSSEQTPVREPAFGRSITNRGFRSRLFRCKNSAWCAGRVYGGRARECERKPGVFVLEKKSQVQGRLDVPPPPSARETLAFCGHTTHDTTKTEQKGREKGGLRNPFTATLFADSVF